MKTITEEDVQKGIQYEVDGNADFARVTAVLHWKVVDSVTARKGPLGVDLDLLEDAKKYLQQRIFSKFFAEARLLARIKLLIQDHYRRLDRRQDGRLSESHCLAQIEQLLGMEWQMGETEPRQVRFESFERAEAAIDWMLEELIRQNPSAEARYRGVARSWAK